MPWWLNYFLGIGAFGVVGFLCATVGYGDDALARFWDRLACVVRETYGHGPRWSEGQPKPTERPAVPSRVTVLPATPQFYDQEQQ